MDEINTEIFRQLAPGETGMKLGQIHIIAAGIGIGIGKFTYGNKENESDHQMVHSKDVNVKQENCLLNGYEGEIVAKFPSL